MDEPVGRTIDGRPWEEPRGPHLPDRLTSIPGRLPRASWAFVVLAIANGIVLAIDRRFFFPPDPSLDPALFVRSIADLIVGLIPSVATMLFGAALFARQPSAWSTHRYVALGVVLLTVGEAMQTAWIWLRGLVEPDILATATAPSFDLSITVQAAYHVLAAIVLALGLTYVARGLRAARLRPDSASAPSRVRVIAVLILLLAASTIVVSVLTIGRFASDNPADAYLGYNAVLTVVGWLAIAAEAYLAVVVSAGVAAGERPIGAWRLGAAGVWAILLSYVIASTVSIWVYLVATPGTDFSILSWIGLGTSGIAAVGYLLLLAAFGRGLPSLIRA